MFIERLLKAGRREDLLSDGSKIVFCLIVESVPALVQLPGSFFCLLAVTEILPADGCCIMYYG
jgi:hypothetical protein